MVKKDNEIELAKLEVKREIAKDVFRAVSGTLSNALSNRNVRFVLGCAAVGWGVSLLYSSLRNSNITNSN